MTNSYKLIDGNTGEVICSYRAKAVALRDCEKKNASENGYRFYVLKPNGGKVTA